MLRRYKKRLKSSNFHTSSIEKARIKHTNFLPHPASSTPVLLTNVRIQIFLPSVSLSASGMPTCKRPLLGMNAVMLPVRAPMPRIRGTLTAFTTRSAPVRDFVLLPMVLRLERQGTTGHRARVLSQVQVHARHVRASFPSIGKQSAAVLA